MPSTVDDHRREHALLVSYLRYRGFREHIADEAASNALAEAWRKAISGEGRMSWLFKVAKRMASRETRHDPATRLAAKGYQPPDARSDGTEAFRAAERVIDLRTAMRELDEREQQVMTLHLHRCDTPTIARDLGLSQRTVNRVVASARDKLRVLLNVEREEGSSR